MRRRTCGGSSTSGSASWARSRCRHLHPPPPPPPPPHPTTPTLTSPTPITITTFGAPSSKRFTPPPLASTPQEYYSLYGEHSILHRAAAEGNASLVRELLALGAACDVHEPGQGHTPLLLAIRNQFAVRPASRRTWGEAGFVVGGGARGKR